MHCIKTTQFLHRWNHLLNGCFWQSAWFHKIKHTKGNPSKVLQVWWLQSLWVWFICAKIFLFRGSDFIVSKNSIFWHRWITFLLDVFDNQHGSILQRMPKTIYLRCWKLSGVTQTVGVMQLFIVLISWCPKNNNFAQINHLLAGYFWQSIWFHIAKHNKNNLFRVLEVWLRQTVGVMHLCKNILFGGPDFIRILAMMEAVHAFPNIVFDPWICFQDCCLKVNLVFHLGHQSANALLLMLHDSGNSSLNSFCTSILWITFEWYCICDVALPVWIQESKDCSQSWHLTASECWSSLSPRTHPSLRIVSKFENCFKGPLIPMIHKLIICTDIWNGFHGGNLYIYQLFC